jgi:hypothetical protein
MPERTQDVEAFECRPGCGCGSFDLDSHPLDVAFAEWAAYDMCAFEAVTF